MIRTVQSALCLLLSPVLVAQQVAGGVRQSTSESDQRSSRSMQSSTVIVPKGTQIPLVLLESISSASARKRQLIRFAVARDVMANGTVLIQRGTAATGLVWKVQKAITGKRDGYVIFELVSLTLPDGPLPVSQYVSNGNDDGGDGWCYGFGSCLILFVFMYAICLPIVSVKDLFDRPHDPPVSAQDETKAACSPIWAVTKKAYPVTITHSDTPQWLQKSTRHARCRRMSFAGSDLHCRWTRKAQPCASDRS